MKNKIKPNNVPMSLWGKDHWSTLAYVECRCVDNKGVPNRSHMRCDIDIHPGLGNQANNFDNTKHPTMLKGGQKLAMHDDWSCVEDMEKEGLLTWEGSGIHPLFKLTKKGKAVSVALRQHKSDGKQFGEFTEEQAREAMVGIVEDPESAQSLEASVGTLNTAMGKSS